MSDTHDTIDAQTQRRLGRRVLWYLIGGFGIVIAANAALVVFALSSWTGLETTHAYDRGLHYNDVLAAAEAQAARGWTSKLRYEGGRLTVQLNDRDGNGIAGQRVAATFKRPTQEGYDQTVALRAEGGGRYGADVALPMLGNWDVHVRAEGQGRAWFATERIRVK